MSSLISDEMLFEACPADWHVITTDIKDSTRSITSGKHETVNLIATGSIIAALNIAYNNGIQIPFFFGGDGAAILAPANLKGEIINALYEHKENAFKNFKLELRVGEMSVAEVYAQGHDLKIAKAQITKSLISPVIVGAGLHYAEKILKHANDDTTYEHGQVGFLSLKGMHCRWNEIKAPNYENQVISLLVEVNDPKMQHKFLGAVMQQLEHIYGDIEKRSPISIRQLSLNPSFKKIRQEVRMRLGKDHLLQTLGTSFLTKIGKHYLPNSKKGKRYLANLVESSDTLVIDGRINTVISGTKKQCDQLINTLSKLEHEQKICFGYHVTDASIMSCYVRNMDEDHIHFVDGLGGGYTQASKMLKAKYQKAV